MGVAQEARDHSYFRTPSVMNKVHPISVYLIATFTEMAARQSSVASLLLWLAVLAQGKESSEELNLH